MNIILIINHLLLGKAIKRYLKFIHNRSSIVIPFRFISEQLKEKILEARLIIIDIYEDIDGNSVSTGLQYGKIFEDQERQVIYFYTNNYIKKGYSLTDLTSNCFYLPRQLAEFLRSLKQPPQEKYSSEKLQKVFLSSPLTSSHH
jgi:hypothetical protein